jgi:hypothetical protein
VIRKLLTSTLLILALLFVVGCGGGSASRSGNTEAAPTASSGATNAQPTAAPQVNTEATPADSTEPIEPAAVGETRDIKDISSSLDGLKSYRLHFSFSFDGKDE